MRKILAVLMLVCALGLFAQIPAGTKSVTVLSGGTSDILADDLTYMLEANAGYFIMDALEIDGIISIWVTTVEDVDVAVGFGLGALYHFSLSPMFGLYGGASFIYSSGAANDAMVLPIDAGLEIFITQKNAIRIGNQFTINSEEGLPNTDKIVIGTVHYFQ